MPICGNAVREVGEECDDGNLTNLDGCDGTCAFEVVQRINWLKLQFSTDTLCTANAFGGAIVNATGQVQLQTALDTGINNGALSTLFVFDDLNDLSGMADPSVTLGTVRGPPVPGAGYSGASDLDWWYTVDATTLDAGRIPYETNSGSVSARVLNVSGGRLSLPFDLGAGLTLARLSSVRMNVTLNAASTPLASTGMPPGHLATEHIDPVLSAFASGGQPTAVAAGKLCGNVRASSIAAMAIPSALLSGGATPCGQNYTSNNSLLDVLVGGCTILGFIPFITVTQPDTDDPAVTNLGSGPPYRLSAGATRQVNTCRDSSNLVVPLQACLDDAAYSVYFKFNFDRVIAR